MSAQHTPGAGRDRLIAELREERDAAIAAHAELLVASRNLIDHIPRLMPFALAERLRGPLTELRAAIAKATGSAS